MIPLADHCTTQWTPELSMTVQVTSCDVCLFDTSVCSWFFRLDLALAILLLPESVNIDAGTVANSCDKNILDVSLSWTCLQAYHSWIDKIGVKYLCWVNLYILFCHCQCLYYLCHCVTESCVPAMFKLLHLENANCICVVCTDWWWCHTITDNVYFCLWVLSRV